MNEKAQINDSKMYTHTHTQHTHTLHSVPQHHCTGIPDQKEFLCQSKTGNNNTGTVYITIFYSEGFKYSNKLQDT